MNATIHFILVACVHRRYVHSTNDPAANVCHATWHRCRSGGRQRGRVLYTLLSAQDINEISR